MSTYDDASLVFYPSGYKTSVLYSEKPMDANGQLTFSRASNATRVAPNGLIEEVRTNVLLQSNTFSTTWTNSNSTETSGQAGYDGTNNAWILEKTAASGHIRQNIAVSGVQTYSVYLKAGTKNWAVLEAVAIGSCYFDLVNGVTGNSSLTLLSKNIVSVGNGWYRCSISYNSTISQVRIFPADGNGDVSGTSGNILIQASQVEAGDVMTDYIATTTTAVSVGPVSGLPRLDYLNSSCPRLLLEPQRSNLVLFSEQMNNAAWSTLNASITSNTTTSPDGYANADKLGGSVGTADQVYVGQSLSLPSAGTYTYSFFAKASDKSWVRLRTLGFDAGGNLQTWFNLADGTIGTDGSGNAKIVSYGNGWYRCSYSFTTTTDLIGSVYAYLADANNGLNVTRNGTGVFLWGAMLELGSYVSSYLTTLSTSVTRVADAASKTGITSLIGQTEGTLFAEFEINANNTDGLNRIFSVTDGTLTSRVLMIANTDETFRFVVSVASSSVVNITTSTSVLGGRHKVAFAYKASDYVAYVDGVQVGSNTAVASVPASLTTAYVGTNEGGAAASGLEGTISQALVFKTRLDNATLQSLTTL
jgi:hypothetical protein